MKLHKICFFEQIFIIFLIYIFGYLAQRRPFYNFEHTVLSKKKLID